MKKSFLSFVIPLVVFSLAVVLVGPGGVGAQTTSVFVCPAGYICTPQDSTPVCAVGYICTPTTYQCPSGYTCSVMTPDSGPLKITSPSSGEILKANSIYSISWTGWDVGVSGYSVYLVGGGLGTSVARYIDKVYPLSKLMQWVVPSDVPLGSGYQIQFSGKGATGANSASFTISSSTSQITLITPNGGDRLMVGSSQTIKWSSIGIAKDYNVQVGIVDVRYSSEAGERPEQIIANSIPNTGSYNWIIPKSIGSMDLTVTDQPVYRIIVHSWADGVTGVALGDSSDEPFSIILNRCYTFTRNLQLGSSGPDVVALQTFLIGKGFRISDLNLKGSKEKGYFGGSTYQALKKYQASVGIPATGYFGPLTRARVNGECVQNTNGLMISTATDKSEYYDDEVIKITVKAFNSSNASITLNFNTLCQSAYSVAFFDSMSYLRCAQTLSSVTIKPQSPYYWEMRHDPSNYKIPTGQYKVQGRLLTVPEKLADPALITVKSRISQSSITVISPKAGEQLRPGTPYMINWGSSNNGNDIFDITLINEGGKSSIAGSLTQDKAGCPGIGKGVCSFLWIPDQISAKSQIYIGNNRIVRDVGYSGVFSVSSSTQPSINVVTPNGGETWVKGDVQNITWKDNITTPTYIQMSYDIGLIPLTPACPIGQVCPVPATAVIVRSVSGPSYPWSVGKLGSGLVSDGSYSIQVCRSGTSICDSSDSYFKITSSNTQPYVTIGAIMNGQKLENNSTIKIGDTFQIQGAPYNTEGLRVTRAFFFDPIFDGSCTNNDSVAVYTLDCTAKKMGSSKFYIEIYVNGNTYRSDIFTVNVGSSTNLPPVISGITAPTTLQVNQTGTWTVKAYDPENGPLSYSVDWGDQAGAVELYEIPTFTHSYRSVGTYNIVFKVGDNVGNIKDVAATVQVGDTTSSVISPQISSFSASPSSVNSGQRVDLSWKTVPAAVSACTLTGDGPTSKSVPISTNYYETQPITTKTTFTLTCTGVNGQTVSKSATVTVNPTTPIIQTQTSLSATIWDAVNEYLQTHPVQ